MNTLVDQQLTITAALASAGDSATLEAYLVEVFNGS